MIFLIKFLKIFVVSLFLVSLLTVSCFATSATSSHTTSSVYGHYLLPGRYYFKDDITYPYSASYSFDFECPLFNRTSYNFFTYSYNSRAIIVYRLDGVHIYQEDVYYADTGFVVDDFYIDILPGTYISDSNFYSFFVSSTYRDDSDFTVHLLGDILGSFSSVGGWISDAVYNLTSMFYVDGALTFLGILSVSFLAFSVLFLLIAFVSKFLSFRS